MDASGLRRKEFRKIYEYLCDKPRFRPHHVSKGLGLRPSSVADRLKEAVEKGHIVGPQIRKKSFANFRTYMYLVNASNPLGLFREYIKDNHILYHEMMEGFCNVRVVSDMNLRIDGTILGGVASDYHISYAPDQPWKTSIRNMWGMVGTFNPVNYIPRGYITTHWDQEVEWSEQDETLFLEFKYDLRKPLEPLVKDKYHMWSGYGIEFLEGLPTYCTIATSYFPETIGMYDPYLYTFETDYEDFIIDFFSELPTTCWFQRVSDTLVCHMWTLKNPLKKVTAHLEDIPGIQIPLLVESLVKKGIVKKENHAKVKYYWRKELD